MWIILFPSIINSFVASNFPVGPVDRGRALDVVVVNQKKGSLPWIYFPAAHRVTVVHNFGDKFRLLNWSAQKQTRTGPSGYRIMHSSQLIQKTETEERNTDSKCGGQPLYLMSCPVNSVLVRIICTLRNILLSAFVINITISYILMYSVEQVSLSPFYRQFITTAVDSC